MDFELNPKYKVGDEVQYNDLEGVCGTVVAVEECETNDFEAYIGYLVEYEDRSREWWAEQDIKGRYCDPEDDLRPDEAAEEA
jgi:hypothetical protein